MKPSISKNFKPEDLDFVEVVDGKIEDDRTCVSMLTEMTTDSNDCIGSPQQQRRSSIDGKGVYDFSQHELRYFLNMNKRRELQQQSHPSKSLPHNNCAASVVSDITDDFDNNYTDRRRHAILPNQSEEAMKILYAAEKFKSDFQIDQLKKNDHKSKSNLLRSIFKGKKDTRSHP